MTPWPTCGNTRDSTKEQAVASTRPDARGCWLSRGREARRRNDLIACRQGRRGSLLRTEEPDTRIAAVFPDGPQRYFDTVLNDDYCHRHGLLAAHLPTGLDEIAHPTEREVVR